MTALYCDCPNQLYGFIITSDVINVNTFFKLFLIPGIYCRCPFDDSNYNIASYKVNYFL